MGGEILAFNFQMLEVEFPLEKLDSAKTFVIVNICPVQQAMRARKKTAHILEKLGQSF